MAHAPDLGELLHHYQTADRCLAAPILSRSSRGVDVEGSFQTHASFDSDNHHTFSDESSDTCAMHPTMEGGI
jgi:hypothetical protein